MQFLVVLALVTVAFAKDADSEKSLEKYTTYAYMSRIGAPLAENIRKTEESGVHQNFIAGGKPSKLGDQPYQAGLLAQFSGGPSFCGGSLLTSKKVVTAAHCWYDGLNQGISFIVVLGSIKLFSGGNRQITSNVVMDPGWKPNLMRNDVAMITLPNAITTSPTIAPIALPIESQLNETFAGNDAVASGYGLTSDGGNITTSQFLSHVNVSIITNDVCEFYYPSILHSSNICISGFDGKSICGGDAGGPLVVTANDVPTLIGISSFESAFGCEASVPAVFSRVTSFMSFINNNL